MRFPSAELRPFVIAFSALLVLSGAGCHPKASLTVAPGSPSGSPAGTPPPPEPKIAARSMDRRVPVIMYHDVISARAADSVWFDTTTDELQKQFEYISTHAYQPITLDQLYDHLTKGSDIPNRSVVLTFDDNYRGFYENALPLLKKYNFPAAMFVHTNFVGDATGSHPKMTWDQLKELVASGLVTIGAHTESHPDDITKLPPEDQQREIVGSKDVLEKQLGRKIDYFAYPDGKNDPVSQDIAKKCGFKLAFTIDSGLAEESTSLYTIHRYEHKKLERALDEADKAMADAPAAVVEQDLSESPVSLTVGEYEGLKIGFVKGGLPHSVLSNTREGVADLARENNAAAGINGSFFAMAAIASNSNVMIGPFYVSDRKEFMPETSPSLLPKLRNRPMVMWNGKKIAIFNFQPDTLNSEAPYREFMPDFTDLFLAGGWIVHLGIARTSEEMKAYSTHDLDDTRRRAFFGWSAKGEPMIGASLQTCSTERLAEAAAAAGVQEAVLLDSGFSTSLVYNGRIVVTGHTARNLPSRPVPHAILLMGALDLVGADAMLASAEEGARSPEDIEGERRALARREQRRRDATQKKAEDAAKKAAGEANPLADPNQAPPGVAPPPTSPPILPGGATTTTTGGAPPE